MLNDIQPISDLVSGQPKKLGDFQGHEQALKLGEPLIIRQTEQMQTLIMDAVKKETDSTT